MAFHNSSIGLYFTTKPLTTFSFGGICQVLRKFLAFHPRYFTIATDGILRSENIVSGANIDGRIKKLEAQAEESHAGATKAELIPSGALKEGMQSELANLAGHR